MTRATAYRMVRDMAWFMLDIHDAKKQQVLKLTLENKDIDHV